MARNSSKENVAEEFKECNIPDKRKNTSFSKNITEFFDIEAIMKVDQEKKGKEDEKLMKNYTTWELNDLHEDMDKLVFEIESINNMIPKRDDENNDSNKNNNSDFNTGDKNKNKKISVFDRNDDTGKKIQRKNVKIKPKNNNLKLKNLLK